MKKILTSICIAFSLGCFAQELKLDAKTLKATYGATVDVEGSKATDLFNQLEKWIEVKKFKPSTPQSGARYATKGRITLVYPGFVGSDESGMVEFDITVLLKDGKYKYTFTNFIHAGLKGKASGGAIEAEKPASGNSQMHQTTWVKIKKDTAKSIEKLEDELKHNLSGTKSPAKTEDF